MQCSTLSDNQCKVDHTHPVQFAHFPLLIITLARTLSLSQPHLSQFTSFKSRCKVERKARSIPCRTQYSSRKIKQPVPPIHLRPLLHASVSQGGRGRIDHLFPAPTFLCPFDLFSFHHLFTRQNCSRTATWPRTLLMGLNGGSRREGKVPGGGRAGMRTGQVFASGSCVQRTA